MFKLPKTTKIGDCKGHTNYHHLVSEIPMDKVKKRILTVWKCRREDKSKQSQMVPEGTSSNCGS